MVVINVVFQKSAITKDSLAVYAPERRVGKIIVCQLICLFFLVVNEGYPKIRSHT